LEGHGEMRLFWGTGKEAPNWTWSFIAKISENLGGKGVEIKLYN
jgi:hypothetical protein